MPQPDGTRLGSGAIRVDLEAVQFLPTRLQGWRGVRAVRLPYAEMSGLAMTEPTGLDRGRLSIRLHDGRALALAFAAHRLPEMRRVYAEIWGHVRAARVDDPGADR